MSNLTDMILKARKKLGLSQWDIARFLGFGNLQFISNIERGLAELPPKHFNKVAKLLKLTIQSMYDAAKQDYANWLSEEIRKGK